MEALSRLFLILQIKSRIAFIVQQKKRMLMSSLQKLVVLLVI